MAMCFSLVAAGGVPVHIRDPGCVAKTFPDYFDRLAELVAMSDIPVVAIDGPTASGKGTIAQRVAKALRFNYLDSGALYRLVALRALQDGITTEDAERLSAVAAAIAPSFAGGRIALDGKDVTDAIRSEEVSQFASRIAVLSGVRQALLELAAFPTQAARPRCGRA